MRPKPEVPSELNLVFHPQEHSLSCEMATLRMVLNYYGVDVSESEVIDKMPWDKTVRSGNIWGDPNIGFVGDIDGKMGVDGYGIHWEPLAQTARNWKDAEIINNGSISDIVENIYNGRPIIIWSYLGRGISMTWFTPEGKKINAINGEHTFIVYGYDGAPDDPVGFLLMDPIYGPTYWEKEKFINKWDAFGRVGVVVYP